MQKLGSGWSTSSDFHFYRRTKLAMHLVTSWRELAVRSLRWLCWTLMSLRTAAFLQLYGRRHPLLRGYQLPRIDNGCESFHSHLSKSFSGPHPNIYHFSNALLLYLTNAYIQLQNIRSRKLDCEETGRNQKGLHKENLGFVYNRPNQSQRL